MSFAWWTAGTPWCAALGWASSIALVLATTRRDASYGSLYGGSAIHCSLGFYWLAETIHDFGGFDWFASIAIFALFVLLSAAQGLVYFFLWRRLPTWTSAWSLRTPLAWCVAELISVRIFPWYFGHTQLGFSPFAQIADIGGVLLISFVMLWIAESLTNAFSGITHWTRIALPLSIFGAGLSYGMYRMQEFRDPPGRDLTVALVQANISIKERSEMKYFASNVDRYIELTRRIGRDNLLVIWPESVIQDWVYDEVGSAFLDKRLPYFEPHLHLLTGALTFHSREIFHNSALAIFADRTVPPPAHKQILMPFGEYVPFANFFPFLKGLNPGGGEFSAAQDLTIISFPSFDTSDPAPYRIAPLICYEDVVPSLTREALQKNAELLVNLTNDAWFGNTVAPFEHHMIAAFRAIEGRRFLLRSTNSGLTAIVDPLGATTHQLPVFSEGAIVAPIKLMSGSTLYAWWGDWPWWALAVIVTLKALLTLRKARPEPS